MKSLSPKKLILIGFIVVLLIAIPLTIFFLQQQQDTQTQAEQATTLSFEPASTQASPISAQTGENVRLDVVVDPGVNQNLVSFVRLEIQYDPSKLAPVEETDELKPFQENTAALTLLEGPVITPGSITATLSVGVDPTKVIQTKTTIAAVNFVAIEPTGDAPTEVTFTTTSQVLSAGTGDEANENVLASRIPAYVAITGEAGVTPSVSVTPGEETSPTPSISTTVSPTASASVTPGVTGTTGSSTNVAPVCEGLNATGATSGTAPFTITLNALGSDSDGTISRATFSFGDGQVQSVTSGGGLGTSGADVSVTHTYQTAGTYQAAVVFTDNNNSVSSSNCTLNVTATDSSTSTSTSTSPTATPIPDSTLPDTGPEDLIVIAGILTSILTIAGAFIFFSL